MKAAATIVIVFILSILIAGLLIWTNNSYILDRMVQNSYFYTFVAGIGITIFARWIIDKASSIVLGE